MVVHLVGDGGLDHVVVVRVGEFERFERWN